MLSRPDLADGDAIADLATDSIYERNEVEGWFRVRKLR